MTHISVQEKYPYQYVKRKINYTIQYSIILNKIFQTTYQHLLPN